MHTDMDLRKSYSTDQMRKSDASMDRVLAKSRKMLKQSNGAREKHLTRNRNLKVSTTPMSTSQELKVPEYLSPKKSKEPEMNFTSSLHVNSYGWVI